MRYFKPHITKKLFKFSTVKQKKNPKLKDETNPPTLGQEHLLDLDNQ